MLNLLILESELYCQQKVSAVPLKNQPNCTTRPASALMHRRGGIYGS
jgi:hypothetical protein